MDNNLSRHIAIYCRVSTDEQAREGVSLDEQQERLQAYCRAMGWAEEILLFIDDGFSAKSTDRPQLHRLMEHIRNEQISKVMVTKLDRMSRRLLDLLTLIDMFQEHQVAFISISESFDTNTPSGRLTLQVLGAVAEFERERIRERVLDNMFHAANQGKWLTQSPYGYRLEQKELVIHEPEASIVRRVYDLYDHQGLGYWAIARRLNEEGIPSKQNKEWSIRSIKLMLTNPAYKGTFVWNRTDSSKKKRKLKEDTEWIVIDDCLPAIIDTVTWDHVQAKMSKQQIAPRAQTSPHLLGGLLKCGHCGVGMSIGWSGSRNRRYRVYRCSANKNHGTCTSRQYRADEIESSFLSGLSSLSASLSMEVIPQLIVRDSLPAAPLHQRIHAARTRYKRKIEAYASGLIDISNLEEEKQRLDRVIAENQSPSEPLDKLQFEQLGEMIANKISTISDAIGILPVEEAKALLKTLIVKVTVRGEKELDIELDVT